MSSDANRPFSSLVHLVMAIRISMCVSPPTGWYLLASVVSPPSILIQQGSSAPAPAPAGATTPEPAAAAATLKTTITMNPMMGMDEPSAVRFFAIDLATALVVNLKMVPPNASETGPDAAVLKQVYLIMSMIVSVVMIVVGVIYPVVSLRVASRPGFRAALAMNAKAPMVEWKQP